jgi:tetratricopeptide (TPR) repeat protein
MKRNIILAAFFIVSIVFAQVDSTGIKLIEQKKYSEAKSFFESAVKKNKKDSEARYYYAMSLMFLRNIDDAEDEIDEAISINEKISKYHMLRGNILGQKAMSANVVSQGFLAPKIKNAYLRASELDPSNIDARNGLFMYYLMAPGIMGGSDEKALEQANAITALDVFRGHLTLATYYNRKKDFQKAETEYKEAIKCDPKKGIGYKQFGYFYMNQKRYADALEQMKKYIEVDPKNPDSHDSYADVLLNEGKIDQAIEKYQFAISIDKNFSPSIFSLAECYEKKGLKVKAKETYQWFLTIEPEGRRADAAKKKINEM